MSEIFLELFSCLIRCFFILSIIYTKFEIRESLKKITIFILIYIVAGNSFGKSSYREYLFWYIYTYAAFYIFFRYVKISKKIKFWQLCILLDIYEMIILFSSIISTIIVILVPIKVFEIEIYSVFLTVILRGFISFYLYRILKKYNYEFKEYATKKYLIYSISLLIICSKIPFLYTDIHDAFEWKVIFLTIICCTIIFFIISKIEKHNAEKEKARIEKNNKILSTKLHKSREILPAMVQVLNNVTENNGAEMETEEVHKLLWEVNNLYGQQLKENEQEDLQLKSFCSTGLKILDQQLIIYQREAIDKGVNFDIYVQAPINDILKRDDIDQLKFQRALGDLVRNAFRSTEREDKKCQAKGHILLIIGCKCENILEIDVVDNGIEFPLYVIEAFGKRGVTTGGMGNGLADLVEFAKEMKASICLNEFEGRTNSFTKKISIIFDKQGINKFNSTRNGLITGPFWSTT